MGDVMVLKKAKVAVIAAAAALALGCGLAAGTTQAYADEVQADLALTTQMNAPAITGETQVKVAVNDSTTIVVSNKTANQTGAWTVKSAAAGTASATISPAKDTVADAKSEATVTVKGVKKGKTTLTVTYTTDSGQASTQTINVTVKGLKDTVTPTNKAFTYTIINEKTPAVEVKSVKSGTTAASVPATVTDPETGMTYKVTHIGQEAFKNAKKTLKSVKLSSTLKIIRAKAFKGCKMTKVTGGKNVVRINDNAFYGCSKMTKCEPLTKSTKLEKIGIRAFGKTNSLKNPAIASKVLKKIDKQAFYKAAKARTLTLKSTALTKKGVKNSLSGAKTVKVVVAKKAYKSYFTKANCAKKVVVKVA